MNKLGVCLFVFLFIGLVSSFNFGGQGVSVTTTTISGNLTNLSEMQDVNIPTPNDNEVLTYDSATSKWTSAIAGAGAEVDPKWTANITNYFTKAQWNVTNTSYALNQTLTDMWTLFLGATNTTYLRIDQWNSTNSTYDAYNSTGLIQNWNVSGWIRNQSGNYLTTESDPLAYNGTLAYNSTLANMWTLFLGATNTTYLRIDQWNSTNSTYNAYNSTGLIKDWNISSWIINWNATGYIQNWNASGWIRNQSGNYLTTESDPLAYNGTLMRMDQWNSTNSTYNAYNSTGLIKDWNISTWIANWNSTGYIQNWNASGWIRNQSGSYITTEADPLAYNGTLMRTNQWNATNTTYLRIDQWNSTNTTYLRTDLWNATNTTYREKYNETWVGNQNTTGNTNSTYFFIRSIGANPCPITVRGIMCRNDTATYIVG